jgi:hypothetical protein
MNCLLCGKMIVRACSCGEELCRDCIENDAEHLRHMLQCTEQKLVVSRSELRRTQEKLFQALGFSELTEEQRRDNLEYNLFWLEDVTDDHL